MECLMTFGADLYLCVIWLSVDWREFLSFFDLCLLKWSGI